MLSESQSPSCISLAMGVAEGREPPGKDTWLRGPGDGRRGRGGLGLSQQLRVAARGPPGCGSQHGEEPSGAGSLLRALSLHQRSLLSKLHGPAEPKRTLEQHSTSATGSREPGSPRSQSRPKPCRRSMPGPALGLRVPGEGDSHRPPMPSGGTSRFATQHKATSSLEDQTAQASSLTHWPFCPGHPSRRQAAELRCDGELPVAPSGTRGPAARGPASSR